MEQRRNGGAKVRPLTKDHKPGEEGERRRIVEAGGQIYQTTTELPEGLKEGFGSDVLVGPCRVFPGRLSVSRTFGDPEAKLPKYGGNPNVVIARPDITSFKIAADYDFVVIGCDGIFDQLSNRDVIQCAWNTAAQEKGSNVHQQCAFAVDSIMKNALLRRSLDNVTAVMIAFENFKELVFPKRQSKSSERKPVTRNGSAKREHIKLLQTITSTNATKPEIVDKKKEGFLDKLFPQSARGNKSKIGVSKPRLLVKLH